MIEWLIGIAVLAAFLAVLPIILRRTRNTARKSGGSGVVIAIGLVFSMIFDPKASQATELIDRKKDIGDEEDGESADRPESG